MTHLARRLSAADIIGSSSPVQQDQQFPIAAGKLGQQLNEVGARTAAAVAGAKD
jgi:hypothetical protein